MTTEEFKLTIHMVSSADGIVAKKDNNMAWFDTSDSYDMGVDAAIFSLLALSIKSE